MNPLNRRIIDQWHRVALSGDRTARDAMFHDDAVFESPVVHTPQRGKAITIKYLAGAPLTFANSGFEYVGEWSGDNSVILEFKCEIKGDVLQVTVPPHRMDISEGVVGLADVLEEVARSYGYDNIPTTTMADALPPQVGNPVHEWEERVRDLLVSLGLHEVVNYRMTSPERESRLVSYNEYVTLATPLLCPVR